MAKTYSKKAIAVTVALQGQKAITFNGFAVSVSISKSGCPAFPKATVSLKGLKLETMAQLTFLGYRAFAYRRNSIRIEAGEQGKTLSTIFKGQISRAWADFNSAPSPTFKIEARCGLFPALVPQAPITVKGTQPASNIFQQIANEIGYEFENNDITTNIKDFIISGDPVTKLKTVAQAIGCNVIFDDDTVVLVDKKASRKTKGSIPVINAQTGMIGYPTFSNTGISVSTFFNPSLRIGADFKLETIVPKASGTWKITSLSHELTAYDPNGSQAWRTNIQAVIPRW